jgi:hypothetical protein
MSTPAELFQSAVVAAVVAAVEVVEGVGLLGGRGKVEQELSSIRVEEGAWGDRRCTVGGEGPLFLKIFASYILFRSSSALLLFSFGHAPS